jgi:hypothetical protein
VLVELGGPERFYEKPHYFQRRKNVFGKTPQGGELPEDEDCDEKTGSKDRHSRRIIL